ncbi:MAG TPA: DUF5916 domain-containing protein, partial [Gemmatimonadaceae bacterium]
MRVALVVALAILFPVDVTGAARLAAQTAPRGLADSLEVVRARIVAATGRPVIDGRLGDAVWSGADSIADFRQREPTEGSPASERSVVKVARDNEALYVAVRAYDGDTAGIRATQFRRDADLDVDDNVTLLLDTFHDQRTAFLFRTNPNGAMWDAQLGGIENTNENWNGIWEVAVARDSLGWSAEFRIPFTTLRFSSDPRAVFGFNVRRAIRRKNEEDLWRAWPRNQGLVYLVAEGELAGVGASGRQRNLELKPYVLGRAVEPEHDELTGERLSPGSAAGKVGLDAKAAITPTLTADVTVNTDFAQVEVDRQVINLTRFPTFFPEKRDFFLESSGIFEFGTSERAQLFYSRRVGLDSSGTPVPIIGGARVTGRVGAWSLGILDARTGGADGANDAVVRVKHDFFARSYVGVIAMDRSGPGVRDEERAAGVDGQFPLVIGGQNVVPSFWIAGTRAANAAARSTPMAWRVATDYPNDRFDHFVSLYRIDAGFDPTLGFVRRTGIWETTGHVTYSPRPHMLGIRRLELTGPIPEWDIIADDSGSITNPRTWQSAELEWRLLGGELQSGDEFGVSLQRWMDAPTEAFEVFRNIAIAPARYWWTRGELRLESSQGRAFAGDLFSTFGDFYDGHSVDVSVSGTWRPGGHLGAGVDLTRTQAALPAGSFTAVEAAGRLEYALSTRTDFLGFVQFNNEDRRADFNLRLHWIPTIGD